MVFNQRKKNKKRLLEAFGSLKIDAFDFKQIEKFFRKKDHSSTYHTLSDKTCADLDFNDVFKFIDRTTSRVGQQYLYNKLRTIPSCSAETSKQEKLINEFCVNSDFRVSVQCQLDKLNAYESFNIASLFQDELIKPPKWYLIIPLLSFTSLLSIIALFFNPVFFFVLLSIFIINIGFHYWNKKNLSLYYSSIPQLLKLNEVARELIKDKRLTESDTDILKSIRVIDKVRSRMSFFDLEVKMQSDSQLIFWGMLELIKILFLIEPLLLFGALKKIDSKRKEIENIFLFVGQTDSLVSIASLRKGLDHYCIPKITEEQNTIVAKDVYHPLINGCVKNSIDTDKKSILLTGSNMSGKTSFIRTIGVNIITGLTLNTCFALQFSTPRLKIFSAIRISDDLMNNKSYYFEEVLTIKEMIDKSENGNSNLFLLDELFKGTNTVERISAGKAVLSSLAKADNIVFVSTHDIELTDLLKDEYDLYHFSESINNKAVDFDYKLKEGRLKNRNAIRILQINDYPGHIIKEASELAIQLDNANILLQKKD
jgi:hypothetical protein